MTPSTPGDAPDEEIGWPESILIAWVGFCGSRALMETLHLVRTGDRRVELILTLVAIGVAAIAAAIGLFREYRWAFPVTASVLGADTFLRLAVFADNGRWPNLFYAIGNAAACWYLFTRLAPHPAPRPDAQHARPDPAQTAAAPVTGPAARIVDIPAAPASAPPQARDAAMRAIHHHISSLGGASLARPEDVRRLAGEHGVTLAQLGDEAAAMYQSFLRHYAPHGTLGPEARREMDALARLLELPEDALQPLR